MKREAWGHRKIVKLARKLHVDECFAVGILESLWRVTDQEAPTGDIGKLSNEDIALAIRFTGNPDELVAALEHAGWIDAHPEHRFIIHDWPDHCDNYTHSRLSRRHLLFADGSKPHPNKHLRLSESETKSDRRRKRERDAGGAIIRAHRRRLIQEMGAICVACHAVEDLTIDHIIPISRGGTNDLGNLRVLCRSCNSKKGDKLISVERSGYGLVSNVQ